MDIRRLACIPFTDSPHLSNQRKGAANLTQNVKKDPVDGPDPVHIDGADGRIRTAYLLITNQLLYQLSYAGRTFDKVAEKLLISMVMRPSLLYSLWVKIK